GEIQRVVVGAVRIAGGSMHVGVIIAVECETIGHGFVPVSDSIAVYVHYARELRFLRDHQSSRVPIFHYGPEGVEKTFRKLAPRPVDHAPDSGGARCDYDGAIRGLVEAERLEQLSSPPTILWGVPVLDGVAGREV